MTFVTSRKALVDGVDYLTMTLGHHVENAAKAKVYACQGRKMEARWYGMNARQDLGWYLEIKRRTACQP